ncbi:MAG: hypothetical protein FJX46_13695 [Alphaproteobacteria bacterium]|nr:hypothetical protein [Alphaproteobacteria bacterium]
MTKPPPADAPPDLAGLATRFLDLWQEQLASWAADPAFAEALAGLMALGRAGGAGMMGGMAGGRRNDTTGTARGADSAAAASGQRADDLARLAARLERCEARLAALERGTPRRGRAARTKPRRRKS